MRKPVVAAPGSAKRQIFWSSGLVTGSPVSDVRAVTNCSEPSVICTSLPWRLVIGGNSPNITRQAHDDCYRNCSDAECENKIVSPEHSRGTETIAGPRFLQRLPEASANENISGMPRGEVRKITLEECLAWTCQQQHCWRRRGDRLGRCLLHVLTAAIGCRLNRSTQHRSKTRCWSSESDVLAAR